MARLESCFDSGFKWAGGSVRHFHTSPEARPHIAAPRPLFPQLVRGMEAAHWRRGQEEDKYQRIIITNMTVTTDTVRIQRAAGKIKRGGWGCW